MNLVDIEDHVPVSVMRLFHSDKSVWENVDMKAQGCQMTFLRSLVMVAQELGHLWDKKITKLVGY